MYLYVHVDIPHTLTIYTEFYTEYTHEVCSSFVSVKLYVHVQTVSHQLIILLLL